ncbi:MULTISPECIES: hypothetical protein [unclassified Paenibacillus]|uniref:hypothetical protein n=1 Tax=unclassified Paenibacillus TaxID=185978 RepID=UPI003625FC14
MLNYHFKTEGSKETGDYKVYECNNGNCKLIYEINGLINIGGLKEARQAIGRYLISNGHSVDKVFQHQCIKPGREKNPTHKWTVQNYLIGVPQTKKR